MAVESRLREGWCPVDQHKFIIPLAKGAVLVYAIAGGEAVLKFKSVWELSKKKSWKSF
jgi:hypothetical protein